MHRVFTKIAIIAMIVMFVLTAVYLIFFHVLKQTEPSYSGAESLIGLQGEVTVYFDSLAIPYIRASSEEDAAFTLGYLHARERLFQMDVMRRAGEGRLSEIFGEKTLAFDQMFKTIGIYRTAEKIYQSSSAEAKKMLEAYSNGVNEYIKKYHSKLPVEFEILNYDPYLWTPIHSIVITRMLAWELNISWWADYAFVDIIRAVGSEKARFLLPEYPENGTLIIPRSLSMLEKNDDQFLNTDKAFRKFMGLDGTHIGSNNWVIGGQKSASGKPIIANDPHLTLQAPGRWYFCSIRSKEWNADGVTIPGVPAVVIGKNDSISWAMTNVMADDADFYIDSLDARGENYLSDGKWIKLQKLQDTISISNAAVIPIEIAITHHGPVISGVHSFDKIFSTAKPNRRAISMRWLGNEVSREYESFLAINKAQNWNAFTDAVNSFSVPGQNFVYADKASNIGYICGARLPIRNSISPIFIYDGTKTENDWAGFVPVSEMPRLYNPPQNYIASANNKTVESFSHYITNLWEPSSRIDRIVEMIDSIKTISVDACKGMQMDVKSPYAIEVVSYLLDAFKGKTIKDDNLRLALTLLQKWDGRFDKESQAPAIWATFFDCLLQNTFKDDLGESLYNEYVFVPNIPYRVLQKLLKSDPGRIFDDSRTPGKETRDDILRKSLVAALARLEKTISKDVKYWQWGRLHTVTLKHFFHGNGDAIEHAADIGPFDIGGDGTTVNNGEYNFYDYTGGIEQFKANKFENVLGPSMRWIYDFANPDVMYFVQPTGQSGITTSEHYSDMTSSWLNGNYYTIRTDASSVESNPRKLILLPGNP